MKTQSPKLEITRENFPALHTFLRGYFHEDMVDEYGTAPEAADQFCDDADSDERIRGARVAENCGADGRPSVGPKRGAKKVG